MSELTRWLLLNTLEWLGTAPLPQGNFVALRGVALGRDDVPTHWFMCTAAELMLPRSSRR